MKYDITKPVRPKMPKLGKGLESVNLLLSQVSKLMHEPLAPLVFPSLGAHVNGCEFMYPSGIWMEPCGLIAHLCAEFSGNKGQIGLLAEAICRDFRAHDEESDKKLKDWDKAYKWNNQKDRPPRPDVAFFFPPADCTPAGRGHGRTGRLHGRVVALCLLRVVEIGSMGVWQCLLSLVPGISTSRTRHQHNP